MVAERAGGGGRAAAGAGAVGSPRPWGAGALGGSVRRTAAATGARAQGSQGAQLLPRWLRSATREHAPINSLAISPSPLHDDPPPSYTWSESRPRRAWGAVAVPAAPGWPAPLPPPLAASPWTMSPPQRRPSQDYDQAGPSAAALAAPAAPAGAAGPQGAETSAAADASRHDDGPHGQGGHGPPEASPRKRMAEADAADGHGPPAPPPASPGRSPGRTPGRENWRLRDDPTIGHVWPSDWGSE